MVANVQDFPHNKKQLKLVSAGRRTAGIAVAGTGGAKRRRGSAKQFEPLEQRTLLSATLFVTGPGGSVDSTHFGTLQAALMVAVTGDTILLQPGFAMGTFGNTTLVGTSNAGDTTIRVAAANLDVGEVVSIGTTTGTDPLERALVTSVVPSGTGDFLVTLATPLLFSHTNSPVNALNSSTTGPTIGLAKGLTLSADPAGGNVTMPFALEVWTGTTGAKVSNLNFTTGSASSVFVDGDGNSFSGLVVSNQILLSNAHGNTFSNVTVNNRLFVDTGSTGNLITDSTLKSLQLRTGTNHNSFLRNTIGPLTAIGSTLNANGGDLFQDNTFTGKLTLTGNSTSATNTAFVHNTFTVASGNILVLEHVDGAILQNNTFNLGGAFATAITVHNSDNVVITGNTVTTTGMQAAGMFIYADATGKTSADIRNNVIHTTDGTAIMLGKYDTTASLEVRIQNNDLTNNAMGVSLTGDGASAGNVDVGGGTTKFGVGAGGNDFSTFAAADAGHFAVGLFSTDAGFMTHADNNKWSVQNPLSAVADSLHTPDAMGTGLITAALPPPPPPPVEVLSEDVLDLSAVETGTTNGVVAHFSSSFKHVPADFTVTITWEDGTTSLGTVVVNSGGGFDVVASHLWKYDGTFDFSVKVVSNAGMDIEMDGVATIATRVLTATGTSFTIDKKNPFSSVVATFADNLPGTLASAYVASVAWSDGTTTVGTVVKNADGTFSIKTSRGFTVAGVMVASVSVATLDGSFFATTSLTATITNKNDKVPGPREKDLKKLALFLRYHVEHGKAHQDHQKKCCPVKKGCLK